MTFKGFSKGMIRRNILIMEDISGGATVRKVALDVGLTPERIRQIVTKMCKRCSPDIYHCYKMESGAVSLRTVRAFRHEIMIDVVSNYERLMKQYRVKDA